MAKLLLPLAESSVRFIRGVGVGAGFFVGSAALGGGGVLPGGWVWEFGQGWWGARVLNCRVGNIIFPNFLSS